MSLIRYGVLLVFFSFSAFAADLEAFHIEKFISGRSIPPAPNMVIQSVGGNSGLELVTEPLNLGAGEILLRRGFGNNEYGLYKGLLAVEAYSRLSVFEVPKGTKPSDFVNCKFYESEVVNPDLDIHSIYFDNDYIYAENTAKLYFNLGETDIEWNTLEMMTEKPWRLSITTEPQGAEVYIDDKLIGKTPLLANALTESIVRLKISIDGYYSIEVMVQKEAGKILEKNFTMNPQVSVADISKGEQFAIDSSQSARDVINIIAKLNLQLQKVKDDGRIQLAQFEQNYPPLPPRDPFEKSADFARRELEHKQIKEAQRKAIEQSIEESVENTKKAIEIAEKYRIELEKRVYSRAFPLNLINLSNPAQDYDADAEAWKTELKVESQPFNFSCKGKILIPPNVARDIYTAQAKGGYLVLEYNDRSIVVDSLVWYYSLTGLSLVYNEKLYPVEGEIKLGEQITASKEYNAAIGRLEMIEKQEKEKEETKRQIEFEKLIQEEKQKQIETARQDSLKKETKTAVYIVPKYGLNFTWAWGNAIHTPSNTYRVGSITGIGLLTVFNKYLSLEPQILYAQRGRKCDEQRYYRVGEQIYYRIESCLEELDYIEIPLTIKIHIPLTQTVSFSFSFDPIVGFLVNSSSDGYDFEYYYYDYPDALEAALALGSGFNVIGKSVAVYVDLKYMYSLSSVMNEYRNHGIALTLGIGFRVNKSK